MTIAKQQTNKQKKEAEKNNMVGQPVATIAMEDHLMMYTSLNLCAMDPNMFAEDTADDELTAAGVVEEV